MNADAEKEIDILCRQYVYLSPVEFARKAMQFAYADSARVCEKVIDLDDWGIKEACAEAIEQRAKE